MPNEARHWVRITGDGLVYDGPCVVTLIIFHPDAAGDYVDIYDGRDTTSGILFTRLVGVNGNTRHLGLGQGVLFGRGIYVDGIDSAVETTVAFTPAQ